MATKETTTEKSSAEESSTSVQLGINELVGAVKIIDICSERGAFKGPELAEVGALRGRFADFIRANQPAEEVVVPEEVGTVQ
jgi:hypothetical protein